MAWTYSGDPNEEPKDAVRFLVGDTNSDNGLVSDEEIEWTLLQNSNNIYLAAAEVAESLARKFATEATSVMIGPIREEYGQRSKDYASLALGLKNKASSKVRLNIYAGGINAATKETFKLDTSLTQPSFTVGMDDSN